MITRTWILAGLALILASASFAQDKTDLPKEGVAVTVYNGGYAVVRETRNLDIAGSGEVKFTDVASAIDATTVHFKSFTDPAAKLLEQNYQFDLVSADKLLKKYLDKQIEVVCTGDKTYSGSLLSFDPAQIVLKEEKGIAMIQRPQNVRDIRFKDLPEGLLTRPTLLWKVSTDKPGKQLAEVSYQTAGMGWHAEYVLVLNHDDSAADITGWVSVDNQSGKTYTDAKMKFIAGDVRRVVEKPAMRRMDLADTGAGRGAGAMEMEEQAFFEYHMYTLPRSSTVADNEVKQLEMFTPVAGVKIDKKFLYNPLKGFGWMGGQFTDSSYGTTSDKKVHVFLEFRNSQENKLGIPLPAGKIRVYKQDTDKAMEFVGEEKINHTPKDEKLSLQIGNAFDLVGERTQKDFKVETARKTMKETVEFKLRNHKKEPVVIRIKEPMYRSMTWNMLSNSDEKDFQKLDAHTAVWDVPVPPAQKPDECVTVTYTVEYTW